MARKDKEIVPLEPKEPRVSPRLLTLAFKKDSVGWRLIVAKVPESTLNNHVVERTEPDVFEMTMARAQSKILELIYK